jgi:hypothetical protein
MSKRLLLLAAALLMLPVALSAQSADFYVIPVSVHAPGANGTFWMSDVVIHNFGTTPLEVELVLIRSGERTAGNLIPIPIGESDASPLTVPPGDTRLLTDVLSGLAATSSISGAILVSGNQPFAVTSRVYSTTPGGNSLGQTVTAVSTFLDDTMGSSGPAGAVAYLPGIVNNSRYRTNLGFVAGTSSSATEPFVIEVSMRDENGGAIGTWLRFAVPWDTVAHLQFSSRVISNRTFDVGTAMFRIISGAGAVVPYASVVDNVTADSAFVLGQFPDDESSSGANVFRDVLRRAN